MAALPLFLSLTPKDWAAKIGGADALAASCTLCPRCCRINRLHNERGFCNAGAGLTVSSIFPHHGEEPPISGTGGSGTIFFSHCTLHCCFCQNHLISHEGVGETCSPEDLAAKMVELQQRGCHNINLVTATHFLPWVLRALNTASQSGLTIPVVYNGGGYETTSTIELLRDIVDIWLPDMKYGDNASAARYSQAPDYVDVNRAAIRAMFRQVGRLKVDASGIAVRGMIIRHLVLPEGQSHSPSIVQWLSSTFDPDDLSVSLMAQYFPAYKSLAFPEINRRITQAEYEPVARLFADTGLGGFFQEIESETGGFRIDFKVQKDTALTGD